MAEQEQGPSVGGASAEVLPIATTELPSELKDIFQRLVDEIYDDLQSAQSERVFIETCASICDHIQEEVTAHPDLAKTIDTNFLDWSLLTTLTEKTYVPYCHQAIKFLIETNPHALVWRNRAGDGGDEWKAYPIHSIAQNSCHCVLMPWIAEHFPWVLDHPVCLESPPHLDLVRSYSNGECDASAIRRFYEFYPKGLGQEDESMGGFPIHHCLRGWEPVEADLIKWMARQHPESLTSHHNTFGHTPLHDACILLLSHSTDSSVEICRFLATECPQSVRMADDRNACLPIHLLGRRANRPHVQKVLMTLLRMYPESMDKTNNISHIDPNPRQVPYLVGIDPLIREESALTKEMTVLTEMSAAFCEATRCSKIDLFVSTSTVFKNWAGTRKKAFAERLADIPKDIARVGRQYEGDDVESDSEDGEIDDDPEDYESDEGSEFGEYDERDLVSVDSDDPDLH